MAFPVESEAGERGGAAPSRLPRQKDIVSISPPSAVPSPLVQKRKLRLEIAIDWMAARHGYEKVGLLTLTFKKNEKDWEAAEQKWKSFETNVVSEYAKDWAMVVQLQQRGAIHYHVVIALPDDIRTGTNVEQIRRQDIPRWLRYSKANVSPNLRKYWEGICMRAQGKARGADGQFAQVGKGYGFGRVDLLPLIKEPAAVANYLARYLRPGEDMDFGAAFERWWEGLSGEDRIGVDADCCLLGGEDDKAVLRQRERVFTERTGTEDYRRKKKLRFSKTISCWLSSGFQAVTFGSFLWRKKLQTVASCFGIEEYGHAEMVKGKLELVGGLADYFGPRWFTILRDAVRCCPLTIEKTDWEKGNGEKLYSWRLECFWLDYQRGIEKSVPAWTEFRSEMRRAWERFQEEIQGDDGGDPDWEIHFWEPPSEWQQQLCLV